jgi:hypothetical protein
MTQKEKRTYQGGTQISAVHRHVPEDGDGHSSAGAYLPFWRAERPRRSSDDR